MKIKDLRSRISRGALKKQIVHELGLLDRIANGPNCRIGIYCPGQKGNSSNNHPGEVAYHIVPQQRGDAVRFLPENVIWACRAANFGEYHNRSLYREKHIVIFGKEYVEKIEELAKEIKQYSKNELFELLAEIREAISKGNK